MGEPMASHLARAGLDLVVHDLRDEPLRRLEKLGARVAASPLEVGRECSLVEVIVVDDDQVRQVVEGNDGALGGCASGDLIVVHSTVNPRTVKDLAARAQERGVGLIDAPVSGAASGATDGTLSVMVGGESAHVKRCEPVFAHFAASVFHVGETGKGLAAKLANNLVAIVNGRTLTEGLDLARRSGIDEQTMLEILNVSTGRSWSSGALPRHARDRAHTPGRSGRPGAHRPEGHVPRRRRRPRAGRDVTHRGGRGRADAARLKRGASAAKAEGLSEGGWQSASSGSRPRRPTRPDPPRRPTRAGH